MNWLVSKDKFTDGFSSMFVSATLCSMHKAFVKKTINNINVDIFDFMAGTPCLAYYNFTLLRVLENAAVQDRGIIFY